MHRRALLQAIFWLCLATGCTDPTPDTPQTGEVWRFAIEETGGSVQDAYAQRFAELVEAETQGAVQVVIYPYGTLGTSDQVTEQIHMGTLQLAMASPGHLGTLIPEVQAFLLHFVLSEDEEVNHRALRDPELTTLLETLYAEKGLQYLAAFSEGWMVWTTRKPVHEPADFDGVKMRVMTSPLLLAAYEAYGADATPLPYAEVYSGLQLRMIDGQVNPIFAIEEMSFYEVTDYLVFPNHAQFYTTVVTNPEFYRGLSQERRELLDRTIGALHQEIFTIQRAYNEERLKKMLERRPELNIIRLDATERARFAARSSEIERAYVALAGPRGEQLLATLRAAVKRATLASPTATSDAPPAGPAP